MVPSFGPPRPQWMVRLFLIAAVCDSYRDDAPGRCVSGKREDSADE